jgi:uncharacterized surface protein with fasciclin (FAS1) repeats
MLALSLTTFSACDDDEVPVTEDFVAYLQNNQEYSLLVDALVEADLVDAVNSFAQDVSLFAPTNAAMTAFLQANNLTDLESVPDDLLRATLLNHIIGSPLLATDFQTGYYGTANDVREASIGTAIFVNTANGVVINGGVNVTSPNILVDGGVIHEIDQVIAPSTLATFASADPNFSILFDAIVKVDSDGSLTAALADRDNAFITVFAPTNAAFQALLDSNAAWNSLDDIDEDLLRSVLLYHLIPGDRVLSSELTDGQRVTTQLGETVQIDLSGSQPRVIAAENSATITLLDVVAENGVIHAIDSVLLPE